MASAIPASPTTAPTAVLTGSASRIVPALFALLFGVLVIGVAGFSPIQAVHNAAHDTRHANGFPCH